MYVLYINTLPDFHRKSNYRISFRSVGHQMGTTWCLSCMCSWRYQGARTDNCRYVWPQCWCDTCHRIPHPRYIIIIIAFLYNLMRFLFNYLYAVFLFGIFFEAYFIIYFMLFFACYLLVFCLIFNLFQCLCYLTAFFAWLKSLLCFLYLFVKLFTLLQTNKCVYVYLYLYFFYFAGN